jgi:hypothetical protein
MQFIICCCLLLLSESISITLQGTVTVPAVLCDLESWLVSHVKGTTPFRCLRTGFVGVYYAVTGRM